MRIALLTALSTTETGALSAELPLAGRPLLAWQAALLRKAGAERVICLCRERCDGVLAAQHETEAAGAQFHALARFAALPALVRAEDTLIVLREGILPDPAALFGLLGAGESARRVVAAIPADHTRAIAHPQVFERIDAAHCWAGLLAMCGGPVQRLADFPEDADAISVLLRLALQAGTPCETLPGEMFGDESWMLFDSAETARRHEARLIAAAATPMPGAAPSAVLAMALARGLAPRGLAQGVVIAAGLGLAGLGAAVAAALASAAPLALALGAAGCLSVALAEAIGLLRARLHGVPPGRGLAALSPLGDGLAALVVWFALDPWPLETPLALIGPLLVGLARLAARSAGALAALAAERAGLLALLGLAAALGQLPGAVAVLALALLAVLLLRAPAQ
ncbi:MAG: hypothetical protein ACK4E5_03745 [Erythrobacter cryptus]